MLYSIVKMETEYWEEPGQTEGRNCKTYELQIIAGETEEALLMAYISLARAWLAGHPDAGDLGVSQRAEPWLRYAKCALADRSIDIADVFYRGIGPIEGSYCRCEISSCFGSSMLGLRVEMDDADMILPANPMAFDSEAALSSQAWEALSGSRMDEWSCYKRTNWVLRENLDAVAQEHGFLERINEELHRIAHEPALDEKELVYFRGQ
ncbi:hypothetical protein AALC25_10785 [Lachnospiraceae bacterium 29-84]